MENTSREHGLPTNDDVTKPPSLLCHHSLFPSTLILESLLSFTSVVLSHFVSGVSMRKLPVERLGESGQPCCTPYTEISQNSA